MKRRIVLSLISLVTLTAALLPLSAPLAYADTPKNEVCNGIGLVSGGTGCGDNGVQANSAIDTAVTFLAVIVGVVAVVMIIVAGLRFITAGGEANKIAAARNSIIYAVIGLLVAALARTIVHFVLGQANV